MRSPKCALPKTEVPRLDAQALAAPRRLVNQLSVQQNTKHKKCWNLLNLHYPETKGLWMIIQYYSLRQVRVGGFLTQTSGNIRLPKEKKERHTTPHIVNPRLRWLYQDSPGSPSELQIRKGSERVPKGSVSFDIFDWCSLAQGLQSYVS